MKEVLAEKLKENEKNKNSLTKFSAKTKPESVFLVMCDPCMNVL
jgi:hypothetical protein